MADDRQLPTGRIPPTIAPRPAGGARLSTSNATVLSIAGMRGNECRERIVEALESQAGVQDASVSLLRARATVVHTSLCTPDVLLRAVLAMGYVATLLSESWPV